jgi:hypothetical protein
MTVSRENGSAEENKSLRVGRHGTTLGLTSTNCLPSYCGCIAPGVGRESNSTYSL